jgi:hypothetical protein
MYNEQPNQSNQSTNPTKTPTTPPQEDEKDIEESAAATPIHPSAETDNFATWGQPTDILELVLVDNG